MGTKPVQVEIPAELVEAQRECEAAHAVLQEAHGAIEAAEARYNAARNKMARLRGEFFCGIDRMVDEMARPEGR